MFIHIYCTPNVLNLVIDATIEYKKWCSYTRFSYFRSASNKVHNLSEPSPSRPYHYTKHFFSLNYSYQAKIFFIILFYFIFLTIYPCGCKTVCNEQRQFSSDKMTRLSTCVGGCVYVPCSVRPFPRELRFDSVQPHYIRTSRLDLRRTD